MRCKKQKFNLIELLVVVSIIAVLGAFTANKIGSMSQRAKVTKAQASLEAVSAAIVNYKKEYGELPYVGADSGADYPTADALMNFSEILPVLRGDNKRGIDFLNSEVSSDFQVGTVKSYANRSFQIALDYDHSGAIDKGVLEGSVFPAINSDVLASSATWVKSPNEGNSDIYSWVSLDLRSSGLLASNDDSSVDNNDTPSVDNNDTPSVDNSDALAAEDYVASDTKVKSNKGFGNNSDGIDTDNKNWEKKAKKEGWTQAEIDAKKAELAAGSGDTTEGK